MEKLTLEILDYYFKLNKVKISNINIMFLIIDNMNKTANSYELILNSGVKNRLIKDTEYTTKAFDTCIKELIQANVIVESEEGIYTLTKENLLLKSNLKNISLSIKPDYKEGTIKATLKRG